MTESATPLAGQKHKAETFRTSFGWIRMELEFHKRSWRVTVRKRQSIIYRSIEVDRRRAYEAGERYLTSIGLTILPPEEKADE